MKYIADFHLHSKYSRATSKDMNVENLDKWARIKGVHILGTGDFTHPLWFKELKEKLEPAEQGLFKIKKKYKSKNGNGFDTRFILTVEISSIYSKGGKVRKIHNLIFAPSFEIAEKINAHLGWIGNIKSDGRPILGLDSKELAKIVFSISKDCMLIPAHAYTPWFSIFGSKSGFDSIDECFEEYAEYIFAIETGLSSDPEASWTNSSLDNITLISNGDAHCVHPDTNIFTTSGKPVTIKDLNPSNVLSINFIDSLKQKNAKVIKLHKLSSPENLYQVKTQLKEIITTPKHRFFVLKNEEIIERSASELKKGDLVACLRQISNKGKSMRLPLFNIDHRLKIISSGINYLRDSRLKRKFSQRELAERMKIKECRIWIFENNKVKNPKESFIDKYCDCVEIDKNKFKRKFVKYIFPLETIPEFTNEKFCQILGYILGDGGLNTNKGKIMSISLTDKDLDLLNYYNNLIKSVFNIERTGIKRKGNSYGFVYPHYLGNYFLNLDSNILTNSPKRKIPDFIFSLPKNEVAAFLRGLFDAEGTFDHHSIQISMSSLFLIKQIQNLLLKFEINSNIYSDFEKNKKKWRYKISIYGQRQLRIFKEEIGFNSIFKKERLSKYISSIRQTPMNSFVDPLPLREKILKIKKLIKISTYDIPRRLYYHLAKNKNDTLKRGNVKEFINIFSKYKNTSSILKELRKFAESDIIWESIQSIKKMKSNCKYVYDLTVPMYENYVANGFITHNSPSKIGREANIFEGNKISYDLIKESIKSGANHSSELKLIKTIEFFPEEGKYHWDGHRKCNIALSPKQSLKYNNICPKCGKPLTIGVMNRVYELADRKLGEKPKKYIPFQKMIPLTEIIGDVLNVGPNTKAVDKYYKELINAFGTEFNVLLEVDKKKIASNSLPEIAEAIERVRNGKVSIEPGYDGEFGKIKIFKQGIKTNKKQNTLF